MWVVTIIVVGYALKNVSRDLDERKIPLMGVLAAAIFASQMLNFTVAGGTSGHLMGAAIATILLGPWAAIIVMTTVVSIQALIFQDGGLLALGANIFNMAVLGVAVSYMAYHTIQRLAGGSRRGILGGGFVAAWTSIVVAALSVALQLALSGTSPANLAIPAMAGVHTLIGIGEGLITIGALALIISSRPDILKGGEARSSKGAFVWGSGLLLAIGLAIASPLASSNPDGLEWVAERQGFLALANEPIYNLVPDYLWPGITNESLATIVAGIFGTLLVFGVGLVTAILRRTRRAPQRSSK
jgi:cobalt/nickel transport system permease protein